MYFYSRARRVSRTCSKCFKNNLATVHRLKLSNQIDLILDATVVTTRINPFSTYVCTLIEVHSLHIYASVGTFCAQIGQLFEAQCTAVSLHLLKRNDLLAHLKVNKCLNISSLFRTIFALLFGHYIR